MHDIALDRITLGNGSNDIIELLGRVFLGPKRAALYSAHAFAVYSIITQAQDARAVVVPARAATGRKSGGEGESVSCRVELGGRRIIKKYKYRVKDRMERAQIYYMIHEYGYKEVDDKQ